MGVPSHEIRLPEEFAGMVRLFPLPNLVLFPGVVQALHIFEPRYCNMLAESLATDQLIAMALLKPGWEANYSGRPAIEEVVCIGKIMTHSPTEDQRHNILLAGVKRAKILSEVDGADSFRRAHVEVLDDIYLPEAAEERLQLRRDLLQILHIAMPDSQAAESVSQLFTKQVPLGIMADLIGYSAKLPLPMKQLLLQTTNVDERCKLLLQLLRAIKEKEHEKPFSSRRDEPGFPPPFSDN